MRAAHVWEGCTDVEKGTAKKRCKPDRQSKVLMQPLIESMKVFI